MNTYRIDLAYFKQGVDFHEIAQSAKGDPALALEHHAAMLRQDADTLTKIKEMIKLLPEQAQSKVKITGDAHLITIEGPESFIKVLLAQKLIQKLE